jgi:anaerobic ribonucleoside-triphosphate reductase activating protein
MNYAKILPADIANGPGFRVSLFVSGCNRRCEGCFNEAAWSFTYGQEFDGETLHELVRLLDNPNIEGLSILGGDPFEPENREAVYEICKLVKFLRPNKTIWIWTGYLFENLKELPVMKYIDVIVDGPFVEELKDLRLKWKGSSNQRVIGVNASLESGEVVLWES